MTTPSCEGCWDPIDPGDDVVLASNPANAPDRETGELRIFERGEFAYFHARCWRETNESGWVERRRGTYADLVQRSDDTPEPLTW